MTSRRPRSRPPAAIVAIPMSGGTSMKTVLTGFARKAIGLYIGDREITLSQVAATPLGPVEIRRQTAPYEPEQLTAALERLLASCFGSRKRRRLPVVLGLPTVRVFFSTRPIRTTKTDASPQVLLHEVLQSPAISIDDMVVDLIRAQPEKRPVASIVSCRKKYLGGLLAALEECKIRAARAEPAACALLRAAAQRHRPPRRARNVLRIFTGDNQGLAVVSAGNLPCIWRSFVLPPGGGAAALRSVTRSMQALLRFCGIDAGVDAVVVHGRGALRAVVESREFQDAIGFRVTWCEGPELGDAAIAFGLALGGLSAAADGFDLARTLRPPPQVRDFFPWRELAVQLALLAGMGLLLYFRLETVDDDYRTVQLENARRPWAQGLTHAQLDKEKKDLELKVRAIEGFLGTRILWSSYTHDIPGRLPATTSLVSFQGLSELEGAGGNKAGGGSKKLLALRAAAPIARDGVIPQEIDDFLDSLRGHPLLKRDFPVVELADIKSFQGGVATKAVANFTVVCLPPVTRAPAPVARSKQAKDGKKD